MKTSAAWLIDHAGFHKGFKVDESSPAGLSTLGFSAVTFGLGSLFCLPMVAGEMWLLPPVVWDREVIVGVLYAGIGCSFVSFSLWTRAIAGIGPVRAGIVYYSLPLYAALAAWLVLGEAVIPAQVVGGLLIVGGIVTATLQTHRTPS